MPHSTPTHPSARYGRLTVIERVDDRVTPGGHRLRQWRCRCECGTEVIAQQGNLRTGNTRSCGCLKDEVTRERSSTQGGHGARGENHPLYGIWKQMHERCRDDGHPNYHNYGGRGIAVCDRWSGPGGFLNFLADMGERPANPTGWASRRSYWTLDRIDNDGPYSPENCRWATPSQQRYNQRPRRRSK